MSLITFPSVIPTSAGFRCNYVIAESVSPFSLTSQVYDWGGSRWEGEMTFETFAYDKPDERAELKAFISSLKGKANVFNYGDPEYLQFGNRGVATGTPLVKGGSQTGVTLETDGWTTGVTGIVKAADYIQLGTGVNAELYQVIADADSDGSGNATLTLNRPLITSPSDNAAIVVTGAKGVFRLAENATGWDADSTGRSRIVLPFVEALNG